MTAKLYVVAASHPCLAVARALDLKGIEYEQVEWPPTAHVPLQRLRFGQGTVPGLVLDGEKTIGSRAIMHRLDELAPEPPLYPGEPPVRRAIERADLWGDEVLQALARRMTWWALRRRPGAIVTYGRDSRLPLPDFAAVASAPLIVRARVAHQRGQRCALRGATSRSCRMTSTGSTPGSPTALLGSEEAPSGAGLQIGSSIALLDTIADLRPILAGRPCLEAALRQFPDFPGEIPSGTLPAELAASAPTPA